MTATIGWDIGGAHLKAARAENGRIVAAAERATPLWQGLDSLHAAFAELTRRLGPADGARRHHDRRIVRRLRLAPRRG